MNSHPERSVCFPCVWSWGRGAHRSQCLLLYSIDGYDHQETSLKRPHKKRVTAHEGAKSYIKSQILIMYSHGFNVVVIHNVSRLLCKPNSGFTTWTTTIISVIQWNSKREVQLQWRKPQDIQKVSSKNWDHFPVRTQLRDHVISAELTQHWQLVWVNASSETTSLKEEHPGQTELLQEMQKLGSTSNLF